MVSEGLNEVWMEAMDDAGDCAARSFDRRRRRYRRGIGLGMEGQEKGILVLEGEPVRKGARSCSCMSVWGCGMCECLLFPFLQSLSRSVSSVCPSRTTFLSSKGQSGGEMAWRPRELGIRERRRAIAIVDQEEEEEVTRREEEKGETK